MESTPKRTYGYTESGEAGAHYAHLTRPPDCAFIITQLAKFHDTTVALSSSVVALQYYHDNLLAGLTPSQPMFYMSHYGNPTKFIRRTEAYLYGAGVRKRQFTMMIGGGLRGKK